ncbi:hypothetical protein KAF25_005581 [Fusarium avenaceum]|uniref:Uncharacterized protein n=1 Tax=Fusarium avenaceum TaxID=40199 RepID=A0A9P7H482_9HYPO|nr:hypothetical protein KAF25_005581 [Fusarium avenaceum]
MILGYQFVIIRDGVAWLFKTISLWGRYAYTLTKSLCCTARHITAFEIPLTALERVMLDWCENRPHNGVADRHDFNYAHGQAVMCSRFRVPENGYFAVGLAW